MDILQSYPLKSTLQKKTLTKPHHICIVLHLKNPSIIKLAFILHCTTQHKIINAQNIRNTWQTTIRWMEIGMLFEPKSKVKKH